METQGLTISNKITILRILCIPVFALTVLYYIASAARGAPNAYLHWAALVLFVVASLTDALDGYLARVRNERTRLGAILDPIADKSLLLVALILLSGPWGSVFDAHIPVWYVWLVISRDVLLLVGSVVIHMAVGHVAVVPRFAGKASTVLQMVSVTWVLIEGNIVALGWMLGGAAAFTLLSAVLYVRDGIRQLEKAHLHDNASQPHAH